MNQSAHPQLLTPGAAAGRMLLGPAPGGTGWQRLRQLLTGLGCPELHSCWCLLRQAQLTAARVVLLQLAVVLWDREKQQQQCSVGVMSRHSKGPGMLLGG